MSAGISLEELQLAARNRGIPLEALRWDITPIGLHYLLTHYDIPEVDGMSWTLEVDGLVERPLSLSLDELRARPAVEIAVTMECAGNGRAHVEPHVVNQPWLLEAVGTAQWRGTPVAGLLEEAGVRDNAVEVLFTALDRGVEGGEGAGVRPQPSAGRGLWLATRSWRTRSTARRSRRSTAIRCVWSFPAGTG